MATFCGNVSDEIASETGIALFLVLGSNPGKTRRYWLVGSSTVVGRDNA